MTDDSASARAKRVMLELAHSDDFRADHAVVSRVVDDAMVSSLIDLAWRHQFDIERYEYRSAMRDSLAVVASRVDELKRGLDDDS